MSFAFFTIMMVLAGEWMGSPVAYVWPSVEVIPVTPVIDYSAADWYEPGRFDYHARKHNATIEDFRLLRNLSVSLCGPSENIRELRGCAYYQWLRWRGLPWERISDKPIPLVRQKNGPFCVSALAASISLFYGLNYSQDDVALSMSTSPVYGTTWANQFAWYKQSGFNVTFLYAPSREGALRNLEGIKLNQFGVIWIVNPEPAPENKAAYHSIAKIGVTSFFLDPLKGFLNYSMEDLFEVWPRRDGSYVVVVVSR